MVKSRKKEVEIESASVLDCLDEEIMIINEDFRILFANAALLDNLGMKKEQVIGQHCYKITHQRKTPCQPPKDQCPIKGAIKTGKPHVEVHTHYDKAGREFLVNVTAAPVKELTGSKRFLHIAMPVKDKTKREEEMLKALKKAERILLVTDEYKQKTMREAAEKAKLEELERFNKIAVGRELKMIELKKKIEELEKQINKNNM